MSQIDRRAEDEHTRKIVKLTVQELFDGVGIDFTTPEGRQKFRENNQFISDWREGASAVRKGGYIAVGSTFLGGLIWLLLHGMDALPTALKVMR